jgi:hypothetical protein
MGENIMLGGLSFQVFSLILFCLLCAEFGWRVYSAAAWKHNPAFAAVTNSRRFKLFLLGMKPCGMVLMAVLTSSQH